MEYIAKFTNDEDGVESYVTEGHLGFHVSIKDTDADEYLGINICYKNVDAAIAKAREIVQ